MNMSQIYGISSFREPQDSSLPLVVQNDMVGFCFLVAEYGLTNQRRGASVRCYRQRTRASPALSDDRRSSVEGAAGWNRHRWIVAS